MILLAAVTGAGVSEVSSSGIGADQYPTRLIARSPCSLFVENLELRQSAEGVLERRTIGNAKTQMLYLGHLSPIGRWPCSLVLLQAE